MNAIIVGAGFAGTVAARQLAEAGYDVTVYEKRPHIAGNMYDEYDGFGILLHKYGPHLFRTDDDKLWAHLSRFGKWYEHINYTSASIDGVIVPMPFNLNAAELLLGRERTEAVGAALTSRYGAEAEIPVLDMLRCGDPVIEETARFFYEKDYKPYTMKQWGKGPDEIDPSVTARVPFRNSRDNRLFRVKYQYLPVGGFTALFTDLLNHPRIKVMLNTDALKFLHIDLIEKSVRINGTRVDCPVIFSGAADELLSFKYGELPYRSLEFEYETHNEVPYQPTLGVCYPQSDLSYTRILEYRHLMQTPPEGATTIVKEYPLPYGRGSGKGSVPYYPMMTDEAAAQYSRYEAELKAVKNLYLVGRLAEYRYYNMDQVILRALETAEQIVRGSSL